MSRKIHINKLSNKDKEEITKDLELKIEPSKYLFNARPMYIYPYTLEDSYLYLPFSYNNKYPRKSREDTGILKCKFVKELREEQISVKEEIIKQLNKYGSALLSAYCGFGKTALGIYISTKVLVKTIIVVNRLVLLKQWESSINFFSPEARVKLLSSKEDYNNYNDIIENNDYFIINAINICKLDRKFYEKIGFCIVDEAHLIMSEVLSRGMQYIVPRYMLGLSATPYRTDGLDPLINLYFGERRIIRKLYRKHIIYKIKTGFKPKQEIGNNGKINWGKVLDSQAESVERNEIIIDIIKKYKDRVFLVLVKRVLQGEYLLNRLLDEGEDVTSLLGSQQTFDKNSRILIGTCGKISVGFDHPKLNTLIMGADIVQYFIQSLGRIFRTKDSEPWVFDLIDDNNILIKHFYERQSVYLEHGGIINNLNKNILK